MSYYYTYMNTVDIAILREYWYEGNSDTNSVSIHF